MDGEEDNLKAHTTRQSPDLHDVDPSNRTDVAHQKMVYVELQAVVICFAALLLLLTVGLSLNLILILAMRCSRRSRLNEVNARDGGATVSGCDGEQTKTRPGIFIGASSASSSLPSQSPLSAEPVSSSTSLPTAVRKRRVRATCNLCIASLLFCVLFAPLEFATVVENYVKHIVSDVVCYATVCLFHFLVAAVVCCLATLVCAQYAGLKRLQRGKGAHGERKRSRRRQVPEVVCWLLPWAVGAVAAVIVAVRLQQSLEYKVCLRAATLYDMTVDRPQLLPFPLPMTVCMSIIYVIVLSVLIATLTAVYRCRRNSWLHRSEGPKQCKRIASPLLAKHKEGGGVGVAGVSEGASVIGCGRSDAGSCYSKSRRQSGTSVQSDRKRDVSNESLNSAASSAAARKGNNSPQQVTSFDSSSPRTDDPGEMEGKDDDDTFDMKMRLKFQKKSHSNSRRHTVANIGIPDLAAALRRGNFGNGGNSGKSGGSPSGRAARCYGGGSSCGSSTGGKSPTNYQYVRKWSVDITALANQLENPKAHTGSFPILREHSVGDNLLLSPDFGTVYPGSRRGSRKSARSHCTPVRPNLGDVAVLDDATRKVDPGDEPIGSRDVSPVPSLLLAQSPRGDCDNPLLTLEEVDDTCNLEPPPSIVVSMTSDDEEPPEGSDQTRGGGDDKFLGNACSALSGGGGGSRQGGSNHDCSRDWPGGGWSSEEVTELLLTAKRTIIIVVVALLLILPYVVVVLLDSLAESPWLKDLLYNFRLISEAIAALLATVLPILLLWSDRELLSDVRRCWKKLRQLKCVCYCNIGPGKSCVSREGRNCHSRTAAVNNTGSKC